ncbi:prevent-host-death protein [Achromobacter spanius]|uniref:prevent-host-death protein n=1 Tax=Achromobacter spanius TaxID=217203 RepID=UPI0037FEFF57
MSSLNGPAAEIANATTEIRKTQAVPRNGATKRLVTDEQGFEAMEQTTALLHLLAGGDADIDEGRVISAAVVFAQIEAMDRAAVPMSHWSGV